jgi:protein-arginine kinase activator protein McsA
MARTKRETYTGNCPPGWCSVCGETDAEICCTAADYTDGSHDDAVCQRCCGPHAPHDPDRYYYPQD